MIWLWLYLGVGIGMAIYSILEQMDYLGGLKHWSTYLAACIIVPFWPVCLAFLIKQRL